MACQLKFIAGVYSELLQPDHCLLCLASLQQQTQAICTGCLEDLPWLLHSCQSCALPLPAGQKICAQCQQSPPAFSRAHCAWRYAMPVNALVAGFKYTKQWPAGRLLSELLAKDLQHQQSEQQLTLADALIPVPLSAKRLRQRGYNQSLMIARWLADSLKLPVLHNAVRRIRHTRIQQGLDAKQRQSNMQGAFAVKKPQQIAGLHLALVDDVLTTGATCNALARVLRAAGARQVDVYCLARTPRPEQG